MSQLAELTDDQLHSLLIEKIAQLGMLGILPAIEGPKDKTNR